MNDKHKSFEPLAIQARDGHPLTVHVYEPATAARATVLALPGVGVKQRVFRHIGRYLSARGVRLVSLDYRGIGDSADGEGPAAASLSRWAEDDIPGALAFIDRQGWAPPVLLAHSFGGQALALSDALSEVGGAILVGAQLGHPHHWTGAGRVKVELFWRVLLPACTELVGEVPPWLLGDELPLGAAREWRNWALAEDWLFSHKPAASARLARFARPVLAHVISDDTMAPAASVDDLLRRLEGAAVSRIAVVPAELGRRRVGHMGLFRPEVSDRLWNRWLDFALLHGAADQRMAA